MLRGRFCRLRGWFCRLRGRFCRLRGRFCRLRGRFCRLRGWFRRFCSWLRRWLGLIHRHGFLLFLITISHPISTAIQHLRCQRLGSVVNRILRFQKTGSRHNRSHAYHHCKYQYDADHTEQSVMFSHNTLLNRHIRHIEKKFWKLNAAAKTAVPLKSQRRNPATPPKGGAAQRTCRFLHLPKVGGAGF